MNFKKGDVVFFSSPLETLEQKVNDYSLVKVSSGRNCDISKGSVGLFIGRRGKHAIIFLKNDLYLMWDELLTKECCA